jgi:hypothetical protein
MTPISTCPASVSWPLPGITVRASSGLRLPPTCSESAGLISRSTRLEMSNPRRHGPPAAAAKASTSPNPSTRRGSSPQVTVAFPMWPSMPIPALAFFSITPIKVSPTGTSLAVRALERPNGPEFSHWRTASVPRRFPISIRLFMEWSRLGALQISSTTSFQVVTEADRPRSIAQKRDTIL